MQFLTYILLLVCIGCINSNSTYALSCIQNINDTTLSDTIFEEEKEYDIESSILEIESEEAQQSVDIVNNILDITAELEAVDSLSLHFALYKGDSIITYYDDDEQNKIFQKFDIIRSKDNEDYSFTFIRQTIFNENNQAWDFIYKRIYNQDGKLIFFVREYNTYNSGCAEVSFERSEYYYSSSGQLSKKTHEIFDSNHNALDLDHCSMEREIYEQYLTYQEFIAKYPLPL